MGMSTTVADSTYGQMVHWGVFSRETVEENSMPNIISYPQSGAVIKTSKRNPASVMAAVNTVNATAHSAAVALVGGVNMVAAAISAAIAALPGALCTIYGVLSNFMQVLNKMRMGTVNNMFAVPSQNAVYAVLLKLR